MNKRLLLSLASLTLATSAFASEPSVPASPAQKEVRSPGKPRAPLAIRTDVQGVVEGNAHHAIRISTSPQSSCERLVTTVYGTRGVDVLDGEARSHGAVAEGTQVEHPVRARVPAGQAGRVVVRATCLAAGQERQLVETFVLAAKGPSGELPRVKPHTVGQLTTDSEGRPVRAMPSTPQR